MAITMTQIDRATSIIQKRISKRIQAIKAENAEILADIETSSYKNAVDSLGITQMVNDIEEAEAEINQLNKEIGEKRDNIKDFKRAMFRFLFPKAADNINTGYRSQEYYMSNEVDSKINSEVSKIKRSMMESHESLREIFDLEDESERAEEALLVATSSKQLRAVIDSVNTLLDDERGILGETAFNTEAPEE